MILIKEIDFDNVKYFIHYISAAQDKKNYYSYFIEMVHTKKRFLLKDKKSFQSVVALIDNTQPMLLNKKIQCKIKLPLLIKDIIMLDYRTRTRL